MVWKSPSSPRATKRALPSAITSRVSEVSWILIPGWKLLAQRLTRRAALAPHDATPRSELGGSRAYLAG